MFPLALELCLFLIGFQIYLFWTKLWPAKFLTNIVTNNGIGLRQAPPPLPHMLFVTPWFSINIGCLSIYWTICCILQAKLSIIHDLLGKVHATVVSTEKGQVYRALLDELNAERRQCRSGMRDLFNSSFGATFLTDTGRESSFAYHIHQYADIYTSKLENFLSYAPESWLHPPHDIKIMPHNAKVV